MSTALDVASALLTPPKTGAIVYHDDPRGFVKDCFDWKRGEGPAAYQLSNLDALVKYGRLAVRAPRGAGKTATNAWAILWFATTREAAGEDWMVIVTAKVFRQLEAFLWGQLTTRWVPRLNWDMIGREPFRPKDELMLRQLRLKHGSVILAATSNHAQIEGAHADEVLFLLDEAWSIPDSIFDAVQGTFLGAGADTRANAYVLVTSTPFSPEGRFWELCEGKIGKYHSVHVTLEEALAAGQVSRDGVQEYADLYGEDSSIFANHVRAEFAREGVDSVIRYEHYLEAVERWHDLALPKMKDLADNQRIGRGISGGSVVPVAPNLPPLDTIGVDIARSGNDRTAYAFRHGNVISRVLVRPYEPDTSIITDEIEALARVPEIHARIIIDSIGPGGPVADQLRRRGLRVVDFSASEKTDLRIHGGQLGFTMKRDAAWWTAREIMEPGSGFELAIPPGDLLQSDLLTPRWAEATGARLKVEKKDEIRKRLPKRRSTDAGDAVVMALFMTRLAPIVSAPRILRRPGGSRNAPLKQRAGGGVGFGRSVA